MSFLPSPRLRLLVSMAALLLTGVARADPVTVSHRFVTAQAPTSWELAERPGFDLDHRTGNAVPVHPGPIYGTLPTASESPRFALPPGPVRGVAFFFHGKGGSSELADDIEVAALLQALYAEGLALVVPDAADRSTRTFDRESQPEVNEDLRRVHEALDALAAIGLPRSTPVFLVGYSAGGWFAGYAGHALLQSGYDLRGILYHQSRGDTRVWGPPPPVPSVWLPALHDEIVDPWLIEQQHFDHVAAGHEGLLLWHTPQPFDERRFTRDPRVRADDLPLIAAAAQRSGAFEADGDATEGVSPLRVSREVADDLPARLAAPVRRQLKVVLATHAFSGAFTPREVAFVRAHL